MSATGFGHPYGTHARDSADDRERPNPAHHKEHSASSGDIPARRRSRPICRPIHETIDGYLVDYLDQRGYLERRPDPDDRRATLICLTDRGWAQIDTALATITGLEEEWSHTLGKQQMEQLRELLNQLGTLTNQ
jgi:hypothetical protein